MTKLNGKTYYAATYWYDVRAVCNWLNPANVYGFPTKALRDEFVEQKNAEEGTMPKTEAITAVYKRHINQYITGRYYMGADGTDENGNTVFVVKEKSPSYMY